MNKVYFIYIQKTPLFIAVENGYKKVVKVLLQDPDIDVYIPYIFTIFLFMKFFCSNIKLRLPNQYIFNFISNN